MRKHFICTLRCKITSKFIYFLQNLPLIGYLSLTRDLLATLKSAKNNEISRCREIGNLEVDPSFDYRVNIH